MVRVTNFRVAFLTNFAFLATGFGLFISLIVFAFLATGFGHFICLIVFDFTVATVFGLFIALIVVAAVTFGKSRLLAVKAPRTTPATIIVHVVFVSKPIVRRSQHREVTGRSQELFEDIHFHSIFGFGQRIWPFLRRQSAQGLANGTSRYFQLVCRTVGVACPPDLDLVKTDFLRSNVCARMESGAASPWQGAPQLVSHHGEPR